MTHSLRNTDLKIGQPSFLSSSSPWPEHLTNQSGRPTSRGCFSQPALSRPRTRTSPASIAMSRTEAPRRIPGADDSELWPLWVNLLSALWWVGRRKEKCESLSNQSESIASMQRTIIRKLEVWDTDHMATLLAFLTVVLKPSWRTGESLPL